MIIIVIHRENHHYYRDDNNFFFLLLFILKIDRYKSKYWKKFTLDDYKLHKAKNFCFKIVFVVELK